MAELVNNFWFFVALMVIVPAVVGTLAQAWQKVRRAEQEAALKQEMLRRGLTVEEMERLLRGPAQPKPAASGGGVIAGLVAELGENNAPNALIEQVMEAVRAIDPSLRPEACRAVQAVLPYAQLAHGQFDERKVLAVLRAFASSDRPADVDGAAPAPLAGPSEPDHTFQPVRPV